MRPDRLAPGPGGLDRVEARLAQVVVAALKEAFDRDSARLELERTRIETERRRADALQRRETIRLAGDRRMAEVRLVAGGAFAAWLVSIACGVVLMERFTPQSRALLSLGWVCLLTAVACGLIVHRRTAAAIDVVESVTGLPDTPPPAAASWLLLAGLALIGASLLLTL